MMTDLVDVVLLDIGSDRTGVIRAIRDVTCDVKGLALVDLRTAMRFADNAPCVMAPNVRADIGAQVKESLESAGATVELRPA
jgi:large subunit ribosomal protein L7/L12